MNSNVYVKWMEEGEEPPGWYRARVTEYYADYSCKIIYDDSLDVTVTEIVDFRSVEWLPCSGRAKKFVPLDSTPSTFKSKRKPCLKHYRSSQHSVKAYADDATLISDCLETHTKVLQIIDQKAQNLDLSFKLVKCVSYLFDGSRVLQSGVELSGGTTRSITENGTKFLGKSLDVSLSATKKAASKKMCDLLSRLLSSTDLLPVRGEYKLWLYRNYIVSLLRFHLSVDSITTRAVSKMENIATRHLKKWLNLP